MDSVIIRGMWGEKRGWKISNQTLKTDGPESEYCPDGPESEYCPEGSDSEYCPGGPESEYCPDGPDSKYCPEGSDSEYCPSWPWQRILSRGPCSKYCPEGPDSKYCPEGPKTGSALTPAFLFLSFLCQLFSPEWLTLHKWRWTRRFLQNSGISLPHYRVSHTSRWQLHNQSHENPIS